MRAEVNVLSMVRGDLSVTFIEYSYVEDLRKVQPGFDLIRNSFKLLAPPPEG